MTRYERGTAVSTNHAADLRLSDSSALRTEAMTTSAQVARGVRVPELDGVRGLAIAMILIFHCLTVGRTDVLALKVWNLAVESLWIGVDLFFVLSGFLITSILIQSKVSLGSLKQFYLNRALRLFPAYYLVLLVAAWLYLPAREALGGQPVEFSLFPFLFYVQNIYFSLGFRFDNWTGFYHFWSLAVEEQFYLVWPLLIWLTGVRHLATGAALVFCLAVAIKSWHLAMGGEHSVAYVLTPMRMDALAAGACLAALSVQKGLRASRRRLYCYGVLAGLALVALFLGFRGFLIAGVGVAATPLVALFFMFFLGSIVGSGAAPKTVLFLNRLLRLRCLVWLGTRSYGIYLIHYVFVGDARRLATASPDWPLPSEVMTLAAGVATIAVSLWLADWMYRYWERPFLKLKQHRFRTEESETEVEELLHRPHGQHARDQQASGDSRPQ